MYVVILALLVFAPVERLDVAKLEPVQTVAVSSEEEKIVLETDTGNKGSGENVALALEDLEAHTPGVIYLDTAEYLLVAEGAEQYAEELRSYLKSDVLVCKWDGKGSVADAEKYLSVRSDLPKLKNWKMQD